jgi:penicillin G amidase
MSAQPRPEGGAPAAARGTGAARRRRSLAPFAYGAPALALAAAGAGLYRRLRSSVPPLDGTLFCPVRAPVRVARDAWGIPHIYAANAPDLFTAQGYVQAQDRLWQMDLQRRIGAGRLSELFGPITLANDLLLRRFSIRQAAEAEADALAPEAAEAVAAYCRGVDAYIAWARTHHALPAEFAILAYEPEPWTPADALTWTKVMAWGLGGNWESELVRARLVNHLGAARAAALEPAYPFGQPLTAEPGVAFAGLDSLFADLLAEYEDLVQTTGLGGMMQSAIPASNNWAVSGARSVSGHAMLANDPHLPLMLPCVWHLVHLCGGGYDVAGATFPGSPGVAIGHNARIAWGTTNAMADAQDLYVERLHPDDPTRVLYEGHWEQGQVRAERIRVRGRPRPVVEAVLVTRHGPVINGAWDPNAEHWLDAGRRLLNLPHIRLLHRDGAPRQTPRPPVALALRWTALEAGPTLQGVLDLNRATDWPSFKAAMRQWEAPCVNMVYADTEGNIGYHLLGHVPRRARGQGVLPAPGWSREYEWDGYIPFEELPQSYNPACGYVVTANNRIAGPAYPYFLGREWATGYRARRIADRIEATARHTLDDFAAIQNDVQSIPGRALAALLVARLAGRPVSGGARAALRREALERLGAWDGTMGRESVAASIYEVTLHFLTRRVYGLALPDATMLDLYLGRATQPVTNSTNYVARSIPRMLRALRENDLDWLRGLAADPEAFASLTWDEALEASLDEGLRLLRRKLGPRMAGWRWERLHRITLAHPLGALGPLARIFNPPPVTMPGDRDTICMTAELPNSPLRASGNSVSYRQLFDLGAWDDARVILAGGQAGQPASPHYGDMIPLWRDGEYAPLPFSAEAVAAATVNELTLIPPP